MLQLCFSVVHKCCIHFSHVAMNRDYLHTTNLLLHERIRDVATLLPNEYMLHDGLRTCKKYCVCEFDVAMIGGLRFTNGSY
jgi:hypothetical protein